MFQYGGPSTFDYKPDLLKLSGKKIPEVFKNNPDKVGGGIREA